MFYSFTGKDANEVWSKATSELMSEQNITTPSRSGNNIELLHALIHIEDPTQRWTTNRVPPISIGFALAELIWILFGSKDAKVINYWNPSLPRFSGISDQYHGAYGYRIRHNFQIDQLERAYLTLKNNTDSRQVVISIWDPKIDSPDNQGQPVNQDIPCNICSLLKVRNNKLEWTQIMRSNDILLGLPYNLIQFTSLQEVIAGWLDVDIGSYTHYSDSLHLYCRDLEKVGISNDLKILNKDSLFLGKEECFYNVNEIYKRMMKIAYNDNISEDELYEISELDSNSSAYRNIMYIITLYVADRKGFKLLSERILKKCTNELFVFLWRNWKGEK
ncbi:thymidylate synthase [Amphibacillus marinus]|uniref:thymidylate synthase n=1 Tax=Amphibacillus marinus TaxID=872970 RepID=A0A1H8SMM0_9BACI|nr:thymidylate synthase [Amphibacillus marinus]SEO79756.1 thymidylate synthase [Amphibacillus marinus]